MCGVGFLYRYGYFSQSLSMDGQQIANYESQNFGSLPIERVMDENGQPMVVDVPYLNYFVHAYVWKVNVGRVPLYLLDTDNEMNSEFDRPITYQLYGGDWENRLKQECGAYLKGRAEMPLMENVSMITTADFFTPYSSQFGNVDVNWDVLISMKINKFLSATINTTLKYDNDVKTFEEDGTKRGAKVQFKEILGVGVAYNF